MAPEPTESIAGGPCPVVAYDGMRQPGELPPLPVATAPCPACAATVEIDPRAVVEQGRSLGVTAGPGELNLVERLVEHLGMGLRTWDGQRLLAGTHGLAPHVAPTACRACDLALLAVVSAGEFQPARWQVVAEGVLARSG